MTGFTRRQDLRRLSVSPLRYPGGKGSLLSTLRALVRSNRPSNTTYVEPYAGGAGAALGLLASGEVKRIVINDLDPAVYAFWRAATQEPKAFSALVKNATLNVEEWERQKEVYLTVQDDFLKLGFATFYLNRTNRSGVLNGGPIGGKDQSGNYKIDARFNKNALGERLRIIDLYSKYITVSNVDGLDVIREYARQSNTFIYADPPYFEKAGSLYLNAFDESDHIALANCLNKHSESMWVLTYDNVPQVARLYEQRRRNVFALNYSAHRVVKANEIMVFSDAVSVPEVQESLF
ncbi:DNA adenine methylase [Micromonospora sp. NPDC053740]|uniref:DNA adenine methylase n=1 Tax=Micromonospora sp. NPDC053740 TaxID=3155173 RepID=UPI00342A5485